MVGHHAPREQIEQHGQKNDEEKLGEAKPRGPRPIGSRRLCARNHRSFLHSARVVRSPSKRGRSILSGRLAVSTTPDGLHEGLTESS